MQTDIIVVLNDNQMFISNRVGALGTFLSKLLTICRAPPSMSQEVPGALPVLGESILRVAKRAKVLCSPACC